MDLDDDQQDAVDLILNCSFGVISGGPGTGKTTVLKSALEHLPLGCNVVCCAPTGKAAKRIMEVTGFPAGTVHRLLGGQFTGGAWVFIYGAHNPLPYDLVIVDETSMLDAQIAAALLRAVDTRKTRMIFVGDANQLPSVGAGQVFADMIDSGIVPVVWLRTVHRAAGESWVCGNAPRILEGEISLEACSDFKFFKRTDPEKMMGQVVKLITKSLPAAGVTDVQVMSPQNGGPAGIDALNNRIQLILNPVQRDHHHRPEPSWVMRTSRGTDYTLRRRDQVIATSNNYDLALFNGETGTVVDIADDTMVADFDGRSVSFTREQARQLRLAYCLTVHRSQGSEWEWVVVVCHSIHDYMWSRQLLYTAITRAKVGVILVGDEAGIRTALHNDDPRHRSTSLLSRLQGRA